VQECVLVQDVVDGHAVREACAGHTHGLEHA